MTLELLPPSMALLPAYAAALRRGWSPNTTRDVSGEQLEAIGGDPEGFVAELLRTEGGTVTLEDGRLVPRLPGRILWMLHPADGFCGSINVRHQPGTLALPAHVSGHVGYAVVPWRQGRGHATRALGLVLPIAASMGLPRVLVTCDVGNEGSRRVILANGATPAGEADGKLLFWIGTGGG